jgi:hypothetical protein
MSIVKGIRNVRLPYRQSGAVLFVALIMLLLLTLLGVTAMQTTTMQERMSGNLRIQQQSFENTERRVTKAQAKARDPLYSADNISRAPAFTLSSGLLPWETWKVTTPVTVKSLSQTRYCVACPGGKAGIPGEDPSRKPRFYIVSGVGFNSVPDYDPGSETDDPLLGPDVGSSRDAITMLQTVFVY